MQKRYVSMAFITLFFIHFFIFLFSYPFFQAQVAHDFSAFLLMASQSLQGMGAIFKDYWDIKPPGLIFFLQVWITIFGETSYSFSFLSIMLGVFTIIPSLLIIKKIVNASTKYFVLYSLFLIFPLRYWDQHMFLCSEYIGLCFSQLSLYFLICVQERIKIHGFFLFTAIILTLFASQIKDPYLFPILALIPLFFLRQEKIKIILISLVAFFVFVIMMLSYLHFSQSLQSYFEILHFKSQSFSLGLNLKTIGYLFHKLGMVVTPSLHYILKDVKAWFFILALIYILRKDSLLLILLFWCIGNQLGYIIQGRYVGHYNVQLGFTLLLTAFIYIKAIIKLRSSFLEKHSFFLSLLFLVIWNTPFYSTFFTSLHFPKIEITENKLIPIKEEIDRLFPKDVPMLCAYGWHTPTLYYYFQRKPITRYFILHPMIMGENEKMEFKNNLLKSPPQIIYYSEYGSDMNIVQFEEQSYPIKKSLICYQKSENTQEIYYETDLLRLKNCLKALI